MNDNHYDVIVIGSGPGGASVVQRLAKWGKSVLILERGGWLPRASVNWDLRNVFAENAYRANETWFDKTDKSFHPGLHYFVGGGATGVPRAVFGAR